MDSVCASCWGNAKRGQSLAGLRQCLHMPAGAVDRESAWCM